METPETKTKINQFCEDDWCEGVFLIEAKSKETFFNRKRKLEIITGFSDGFFDSYEEDDEGGIWKTITSAWFPSVKELKVAIKKMKRFSWLFLSDSYIMLDNKYLYCDGKWFVD